MFKTREQHFTSRQHVLVKNVWDTDWKWMFKYPTIEAYERGGESPSYVFQYITEAEFKSYEALGLFPVVPHVDILMGRLI